MSDEYHFISGSVFGCSEGPIWSDIDAENWNYCPTCGCELYTDR